MIGTCGLDDLDGPGVWYQVAGQGAVLTASTCGDTDFNTKLSIFTGASCFELECVAQNDDGDCGLQSVVSWLALEGQTYFVLVRRQNSCVCVFVFSFLRKLMDVPC